MYSQIKTCEVEFLTFNVSPDVSIIFPAQTSSVTVSSFCVWCKENNRFSALVIL